VPFIETIRLRNVIYRRDVCDVSAGGVSDLSLGPDCAREGVFGLQAAGASHWAARRYASMAGYDSAINGGGALMS
jgi:hypothetical protein